MKPRRQAGSTESPARQLAGFINKFDPAIAKLIRSARAGLRKRMPAAIELVYDNYNALAIGFGPTERTSEAIVSVAAYARGVNLYFIHGAKLSDPQKLLKGSGNQGRFVVFDGPAALERPEIEAFLRTAIEQAKAPLPATGRGYMVIKSISAKQRPRRPPSSE